MSGRGSQKTCPVLMNYFARDLWARWRYDEFRKSQKKIEVVLRASASGRCENSSLKIEISEIGLCRSACRANWRAYFGVEHSVNRQPARHDALRQFEDGKKAEKGLRPSGDRPVELRLGLCLQQSAYPRGGLCSVRVTRKPTAEEGCFCQHSSAVSEFGTIDGPRYRTKPLQQSQSVMIFWPARGLRHQCD